MIKTGGSYNLQISLPQVRPTLRPIKNEWSLTLSCLVILFRCHWIRNWYSVGCNHHLSVLWDLRQRAEWNGRNGNSTILNEFYDADTTTQRSALNYRNMEIFLLSSRRVTLKHTVLCTAWFLLWYIAQEHQIKKGAHCTHWRFLFQQTSHSLFNYKPSLLFFEFILQSNCLFAFCCTLFFHKLCRE